MSSAYLIKDIKTNFDGGSNDSYPQWLTIFDGKIFFSAVDDTGQQELWSSDATSRGTIKVGDIGGLVSGTPKHLSAGRYSLLFTAFTIDAGRELWFVNSGTQQLGALDEVVIGGSSSSPRDIQFLYEAPIYSAVDVNGARTLWRSDIANEQLSSDHILPSNSLLTIYDNNIYFVADYLNSGDSLWRYNGSGFNKVFDYYPDSNDDTRIRHVLASGDRLYFSASALSARSDKLFCVNESGEQAQLVISGEEFDYLAPSDLVDVDGVLYFTASTDYGRDLWRVRPGELTAELVDPLNQAKGINRASELTHVDDKIFYAGTYNFDKELWVYDITNDISSLVKDINVSGDSLARIDNQLTSFGEYLLFVAEDDVYGEELWATNGHVEGTVRLTDINEGASGSDINNLTILGNKAIFSAKSDDYGTELFGWDGEQLELAEGIEHASNHSTIHSALGKGKLKGTDSADAFVFNSYDAFKKKNADRIIGYDSDQGDIFAVGQGAFPGLSNQKSIDFASTKKRKELKLLSKQDYDFVYFEKKGRLYYDGNSTEKNWGKTDEGGLFAILRGKPKLTGDDFTLLT